MRTTSHMEKIYNNKKEASNACRAYEEKIWQLQDEFGIHEVFEDSCSTSYLIAKYRDADGSICEHIQ